LQQLRVALTADNVNNVDASDWGCTALHLAASNGHDECAKFCIEMGANVNARNNFGRSPLQYASWQGHVSVARVLLDAGALVDATDNMKWTPLYWAIRYKRVNAAQLLVDRGAKVSNVKLDKYLPSTSIPDWVTTFVESRSKCRCAAIAIIGIHKYRRTTVTGNNINVIKLIAKHIWSTRMDDVWVTPDMNSCNPKRNKTCY
jgi:hypothetical protein